MKTFYTLIQCTLLMACSHLAFSQGYTYSIYSGSDYYSYVDYEIDKFCDCSNKYSFSVYRNSVSASNYLGAGSKKLGTVTMKVGPSANINYRMSVVVTGKNNFIVNCVSSCEGTGSNSKRLTSSSIRRPTSAYASRDQDVIELRWTSNTDIPSGSHFYRIARDSPDNIIADNISGVSKGSTKSYVDQLVGPDTTHTYYVYTVTKSWGGHVSTYSTMYGKTRARQLRASVGQARQVSLSWDDLSMVTDMVTIRRDGSQIAEVNINSAADTAFSDSDPALVPGRFYEYTVAWSKGDTEYEIAASGASQANGRISGKVQTPLTQLPISGVEVCAVQESDLDQTSAGTMYCDTTDEFGDYELRRIYYSDEATFTVTPTKENHAFDPVSFEGQRLELEVPSKVLNFDDTTAFVVSGRVVQVLHGDTCGLSGVEIWVDDLFKGTLTDQEGFYSLGVEESGTYEIEPRLSGHTMDPSSQSILVNSDLVDIDFRDDEMHLIEGVVKAACDLYIGSADVRIYSGSQGICLDTTVTTDTSGYYSALLPARKYEFEVVDFNPREGFTIDPDEVLSYYQTEVADLTFEPAQQDFIFRRPPMLSVEGVPDPICTDIGVPVVEQNQDYELIISVSESFGEESCLVESGYVIIYDEVGDNSGQPDSIELIDGQASYILRPGAPNLIAPHQKLIQIIAKVEGETSDWSQSMLVSGIRPREQTFATVMPEIPFMILHDPPGDASYSFREESLSSEMAFRMFATTEASTETSTEVKFGSQFEVSDALGIFSTEVANWGTIGASLEMGARLATNAELILSTETTERFSTSDNSDITGSEGDLYIGAALNMVYALTDVLSVDPATCEVELSQSMIMGNDGFATTFMYTEDHVQETLLPQLQQIREIYIEQESDSAEIYENQISVWQQVLDNNRRNKQKARMIENRSFSAGASYNATTTIQSQSSLAIELSAFIDASVAIGAGYEVAGSGVSGLVETRMSVELGASTTGSSLQSVTTGFELSDDDQGDFFSVNIREDAVYGTPVFEVVSGRSSCPSEEYTQAREEVQLQADSYNQFDVPEDESAVFVLDLGNISQSDEPRTYLFRFLQESNPDGAVVTIGGSQAQAPIPYTIPAGGSRSATVTIARGARAFNYSNLQFVLQSGCEDEMVADTVGLSVSFESDFPNLEIVKPNPVWKANAGNENEVLVRFAGFDEERLSKIQLQYSKANAFAWQTGGEWLPGTLQGSNGDFTDLWSIGSLEDGAYDIRFKADYGDGEVYSEIHQGSIDRTGPHIFGLPEPADLVLEVGDVISISFDEPVDCDLIGPDKVVFENTESGEIYPVQTGCSGSRVIISPLWNINAHIGEQIRVSLSGISDLFGNASQDSTYRWSFNVGSTSGLDDNDVDLDGIENQLDNCAIAANPLQADMDQDGIGDICDDDLDGDGIPNAMDNCAGVASGDQVDTDEDGIGDACDSDIDGDGIPNERDNCVMEPNPLQEDEDENGVGDVCEEVTSMNDEDVSAPRVAVFPNPASEWMQVSMSGGTRGTYQVAIRDFSGKLMHSQEQEIFTGQQETLIDFTTSHLPAGTYLLSVQGPDSRQFYKFNVVH